MTRDNPTTNPSHLPAPSFLAPFPVPDFFARHWDRAPLVIRRDDPGHFRDVIDMAELDRLVTSERLPGSNFNLARGDRPLPRGRYCVGEHVDKARALALHQQGATIILRSVEQWSPALNRLRIAAEELFRFQAQINVYLTPPEEKSTPPHWDTHDLLVLQVEGSKRWRLYRGRRTYPLPDERFQVEDEYVSADHEDVVLNAGDTLYLPRGVIHEPIAESYSAHVSIGIHTLRVHDLLERALRLLAEREGSALRQSLAGWHHGQAPSVDAATLADLLEPELLEQAASDLRARVTAGMSADLQGRLLEAARGPELGAGTRYRRRRGVAVEARATAEGVRVAAGEQQVAVGPALKDAVDYIVRHDVFSADELPGGRDHDERLALCVALQQMGVLQVETPAGA